jgi:hypothetical protein
MLLETRLPVQQALQMRGAQSPFCKPIKPCITPTSYPHCELPACSHCQGQSAQGAMPVILLQWLEALLRTCTHVRPPPNHEPGRARVAQLCNSHHANATKHRDLPICRPPNILRAVQHWRPLKTIGTDVEPERQGLSCATQSTRGVYCHNMATVPEDPTYPHMRACRCSISITLTPQGSSPQV